MGYRPDAAESGPALGVAAVAVVLETGDKGRLRPLIPETAARRVGLPAAAPHGVETAPVAVAAVGRRKGGPRPDRRVGPARARLIPRVGPRRVGADG